MEKRNILGIDPGLNGGLAVIDEGGIILHYSKMPIKHTSVGVGKKKKNRRMIDVTGIAAVLAEFEPTNIFIERASARPGQGVVSMFTFGMGYGMILGLCMAIEGAVNTDIVTPQKWQGVVVTGLDHIEDTKVRALAKLQELYPEIDTTHDGIVDAILIAEYGRRMLQLN
jgi:crossover junction endodeoxyribonuclease RuvC